MRRSGIKNLYVPTNRAYAYGNLMKPNQIETIENTFKNNRWHSDFGATGFCYYIRHL